MKHRPRTQPLAGLFPPPAVLTPSAIPRSGTTPVITIENAQTSASAYRSKNKSPRVTVPSLAPNRSGLVLWVAFGVVFLFRMLALSNTTNSWLVFRPLVPSDVSAGANKLGNADMETTAVAPPLAVWRFYDAGYNVATNAAHGGVRSLECVATNQTEVHGGYQTIVLNQSNPKALKLSGWSKAQNVAGTSDSNYSVYLDIYYQDGTWLYGQTIPFSTGTHNWEYQERLIITDRPIQQIFCYLLFRYSHTGTVWFDDITVAEVQDTVPQFDGAVINAEAPNPLPFDPTNQFTLLTGDGLQLGITRDGGVIQSLPDGTNNLHAPAAAYASGWLVCDRRDNSGWWNVGGEVTATSAGLQQQGVISNLNLSATIRYSVTNNAIRIQATVSNLLASDRAISLCFALPAAMDGGSWWNSPRDHIPLDQADETATLSDVGLGARNLVSQYPLATVATTSALTLAVPPDLYRPLRLAYNRITHQFYVAFDVGVSSITTNFPQTVTVEVWLYRSDPAWGLRSGLEGFYRRFPKAYARIFTNEGIWVAFADLRGITNISDFGIAYHEIGYDPTLLKFDDSNGIRSFRYLSEPWSYWMGMPTNVPNTSYTAVYDYLLSEAAQGSPAATAALSSGIRDPDGRLKFFPAAKPWCPYGAAFYLNASPFISDPEYPATKFSSEWNGTVRDVYNHPENGELDGEYVDTFAGYAAMPDYSTNHQRSTSFPLTYARGNYVLMTPLMFGSYEMARALAEDVHCMGKPIMANYVFSSSPYLPLGMGLFDFAGQEINWFNASGNFVPPPDAAPLFARALSGQRPYGYLLNTDFSKVSSAGMEAYIRLCAFYGIYPSAFSADSSTGNYFEQPGLYERDRALFKKYVPIIRALSLAGWQPVTDATTDTTNVGIEAYGSDSSSARRYFTLRNFQSSSVIVNVAFNFSKWAGSNSQAFWLTNLFDGGILIVDSGSNSVRLTLQPYECRAYAAQARFPLRPLILMNDVNFGFHSNRFWFNVTAMPGQVVVIETCTNLLNWCPLQTNIAAETGFMPFADSQAGLFPCRFYRLRLQL